MNDDIESKSVGFDVLDGNPTNFIQNVPCFRPFNCFNSDTFSQFDESSNKIINYENERSYPDIFKLICKDKIPPKCNSSRSELNQNKLFKQNNVDEKISNAFIFKLERKILEIENKVNSNMFKMKQEFDSFCKYIISLINLGQDTVKCFDDGDSSTFNYQSNNPNKSGKMNLMHKDLACLSASEEEETPESKIPIMKISK